MTAGSGRQQVNGSPATLTPLLEASAERQLRDFALRLRGGYSRSASYGGSDYRYRYLNAELVMPF